MSALQTAAAAVAAAIDGILVAASTSRNAGTRHLAELIPRGW